MKKVLATVLAAAAGATAVLHAIKAVDQSNVISLIADKAADLIEFVVRFLLAAS